MKADLQGIKTAKTSKQIQLASQRVFTGDALKGKTVESEKVDKMKATFMTETMTLVSWRLMHTASS